MKCSNCGEELLGSEEYCHVCGHKVVKPSDAWIIIVFIVVMIISTFFSNLSWLRLGYSIFSSLSSIINYSSNDNYNAYNYYSDYNNIGNYTDLINGMNDITSNYIYDYSDSYIYQQPTYSNKDIITLNKEYQEVQERLENVSIYYECYGDTIVAHCNDSSISDIFLNSTLWVRDSGYVFQNYIGYEGYRNGGSSITFDIGSEIYGEKEVYLKYFVNNDYINYGTGIVGTSVYHYYQEEPVEIDIADISDSTNYKELKNEINIYKKSGETYYKKNNDSYVITLNEKEPYIIAKDKVAVRIRDCASTAGTIIGHIYDYSKINYCYSMVDGGYTWYRINETEEWWIADDGTWFETR